MAVVVGDVGSAAFAAEIEARLPRSAFRVPRSAFTGINETLAEDGAAIVAALSQGHCPYGVVAGGVQPNAVGCCRAGNRSGLAARVLVVDPRRWALYVARVSWLGPRRPV